MPSTDGDRTIFTPGEKNALRAMLEADGMQFFRYFFRQAEGTAMRRNWHHYVVDDVLQQVLDGKITRLIINIPPGYTKTEQAVISFILRGLAKNPRAKFIHTSFSEDLANENSSRVRDAVKSEAFQELWPMSVKVDTKGKRRWFTEQGGGMVAAPSKGQITGFRAGRMDEGFTGAFVCDDPLKPDDAHSKAKRTAVNNRANSTMRSRLAVESVPIIVIMQRLHEDDYSGFLLKGGTGEKWFHLRIPALLSEEELDKPYPEDYTHGIEIPLSSMIERVRDKMPGSFSQRDLDLIPEEIEPGTPLWPGKHNRDQLQIISTADPYTFASQMQQRPSPLGGGMFRDKWWRHYDQLPADIDCIRIYCDTAQKTAEHNDYSVFQCWGRSPSMGIFLIDQVRAKMEAPELERALLEFWTKHKPTIYKTRGCQMIMVEDKSSGSSLIQSIRANHLLPIEGIQRNTDKVFRAMGVVKYFASGYIHVPNDAEWLHDYKSEFRSFTPLMTHQHDDQIDPTMDAVEDLLVFGSQGYTAAALS